MTSKTWKTAMAVGLILAATGLAQAAPMAKACKAVSNAAEPADVVEIESVPVVQEDITFWQQFDKPTMYLSAPGQVRYMVHQQTGKWLSRNQAEELLATMS